MPVMSTFPSGYSQRMTAMRKIGLLSDSQFHHDVWDAIPYGPAVVVDEDGTYRMFYTGYEQSGNCWGICVATSADFVKWDKPSLGLALFNGSAQNNLIGGLPYDRMQCCDVCVHDGEYIMSVRNDRSGTNMVYTSSDGKSFKFRSIVSRGIDHPNAHGELKAISFHNESYHAYLVDGHQQQRRTISCRVASSLDGPWTPAPNIWTWESTDSAEQFYDVSFWRDGSRLWACVTMYNAITERLGPLRTYYSDYGATWNRDIDLLRNGPDGFFGMGTITNATPLMVDGKWRMIYSVSRERHNIWPRSHWLCLAVEW